MSGRRALVTGASSGIGRAAARLLAAEGAHLALVDLPGTGLAAVEKACASAGVETIAIECDVAGSKNVDAAFSRASDRLGPIDAVFNNAGISAFVALVDTDDETWNRVVATNLTGSFNVLRAAARMMTAARRGAIVNTASELAFVGQAGYVAYTATKGGILSMTRAAAVEVAPYGVRVNAVCPGPVDTPLLDAEFVNAPDRERAIGAVKESVPFKRFAEPAEIASAVLYLLSDESSYITGTSLIVDGGRTGTVR